MRQIQDSRNIEAAALQLVDDVAPALGPAAWSEHRIEHNRAVMMKRDPIVWKNRVGRVQFVLVLGDDDLNVRIPQPARENVEFDTRPPFDFLAAVIGDFPLKKKRRRSVRIKAK